MTDATRRDFLIAAAASLPAATLLRAAEGDGPWLRQSVKGGMLRVEGGWLEKLKAAKAAGFEGVEPNTSPDLNVEELKAAAAETGVTVDGTVGGYHWQTRHTDPDNAVRTKAQRLLEQSVEQTAALGADTFLIVPGHGKDGDRETVERKAFRAINAVLPMAKDLGVRILIENVWNEMFYDAAGGDGQSAKALADFIDRFDSDFVGTQFDLGNHWKYGDVAGWVRTLGPRIKKLDIKGFSREAGKFTDVTEGDIEWAGVRKALAEIGYTGWVAAEVGGGGVDRLTKIHDQIDAALHCDKTPAQVASS